MTVPECSRSLRAQGVPISSARLSLCIRGLETWNIREREAVEGFLRSVIDAERYSAAEAISF